MNRKAAEQKHISVHWWNMGRKTLDHKGTYAEFLDKKGIKISRVKHPTVKSGGFRAKFYVGSSIIQYDDFCYDYPNLASENQFEQAYLRFLDEAITMFLTYLGDKTVFSNGYGRERLINWGR